MMVSAGTTNGWKEDLPEDDEPFLVPPGAPLGDEFEAESGAGDWSADFWHPPTESSKAKDGSKTDDLMRNKKHLLKCWKDWLGSYLYCA